MFNELLNEVQELGDYQTAVFIYIEQNRDFFKVGMVILQYDENAQHEIDSLYAGNDNVTAKSHGFIQDFNGIIDTLKERISTANLSFTVDLVAFTHLQIAIGVKIPETRAYHIGNDISWYATLTAAEGVGGIDFDFLLDEASARVTREPEDTDLLFKTFCFVQLDDMMKELSFKLATVQ